MKKFVTIVALATSFAALTAAVPASAAVRHHNQDRSVAAPAEGPGYYEGDWQFQKDESDRASTPYAGGVG